MKKLIKLEFNNTTRERKTEDSYSELYSYDKNNGSFEFEILNDTLTTEQVIALFKFTESNKIWKTTGTVEGNKVKVTFDTSLITQNETVICYLYFDEEQRTSDTFRFKFKVKVSEIDKMSRYEVKERFINNTVIVDRLDVVTKDELKEALKNVGGIATEGLLTEVKAEELYAKKTEAVDNTNFELVKNRVLALELKTDKDTVYDDSEVKERLTTLENKASVDLSNYATKEELRNVSGSQPLADNLVTKEELEAKHYISDVSNLATKEELQEVRNSQPTVDTSNLVTKDELESKHYLTQHQPLDNLVTKEELNSKGYVTDEVLNSKGYLTQHQPLTAYALKSELYNDSEVKERLTTLESRPNVDTSNFVTNEQLEAKHYLTEHQPLTHLATTSDLEVLRNIAASKADLSKKLDTAEFNSFKDSVVTKTELAERNYLTETTASETYAKKSELPTPYNDSALVSRVGALENKPSGGQTQDTGWITISNDDSLHGNVVKIRRINDMVHVSLSNPNSEGLQFELDNEAFTVILASKKIGIGFTPLKVITIPVTETEDVMRRISDGTNVIGQVIYKVENGKVMINSFGTKFSFGQPLEVLVNDFSYFTEDPFPTNLN